MTLNDTKFSSAHTLVNFIFSCPITAKPFCYYSLTFRVMFSTSLNKLVHSKVWRIRIKPNVQNSNTSFFSPWCNSPPGRQDLLVIGLHDHTQTHHTRWDSSGQVIIPTQRPLPDNTKHSQRPSMRPARFETANPASERPLTHALDRAESGIHSFRPIGLMLL
jgi:hypothetical protein